MVQQACEVAASLSAQDSEGGDASLQHAPTQSGSLPRQGETIPEWSQASVTPLLHNGKYWAKSPPTEDERRSYAVHPGRAGPQTGWKHASKTKKKGTFPFEEGALGAIK